MHVCVHIICTDMLWILPPPHTEPVYNKATLKGNTTQLLLIGASVQDILISLRNKKLHLFLRSIYYLSASVGGVGWARLEIGIGWIAWVGLGGWVGLGFVRGEGRPVKAARVW